MADLNLSLLALFAVAVIALLVMPGPVTLLVVRAGLAGGMRHALHTICGTNAASLVLILITTLLLKGLLIIDESVMNGVRLAGCAYIAWIAWSMLQDAKHVDSKELSEKSDDALPARAGFIRGFTLGISNPKDILFFASFLPQFIGVLPSTNQSMALLTVSWIVLDFATLGLLALLVRKLVQPTLERRLLFVSAVLLLLIGIGGFVHTLYAIAM